MNREDLITCPICAATNTVIVSDMAWRVESASERGLFGDYFKRACGNCRHTYYVHVWLPSERLQPSIIKEFPDGIPQLNTETMVQCPYGRHGFEVTAPRYARSVIATESKEPWWDGYYTICPQPTCRNKVFIHITIPQQIKQGFSGT